MSFADQYKQKLTTAEQAVRCVKIRRLGRLRLVRMPSCQPGPCAGRQS